MSDTRRKASEKKIHRVTKGESDTKFRYNEYQNRIDEEDDRDDFREELDDLFSGKV